MKFTAVVLAAGQGRRMKSKLSKVLQPLAGVPVLEKIIHTLKQLEPSKIIIVHASNMLPVLKETLQQYPDLEYVEQAQQLGTADAVAQALPKVEQGEKVLILCGDVPLISPNTLQKLLKTGEEHGLSFVTAMLSDPKGLGRVLRDAQNKLKGIVEERDASSEEKNIKEINAGIYLSSKPYLEKTLPKLTSQNAQKEFYLTDIIARALEDNFAVTTVSPQHTWEVLGINTKSELAILERQFQLLQAQILMEQGATLMDPNRFDLRGNLEIGPEVTIDINVVLEGTLKFGEGVKIGPNVFIKNSILEDGVEVLANSVIEGATIGQGSIIGPFARIRPGTKLSKEVKVGNFVELKKSVVGPRSKINHLSYVGDADIGEEVNIGAGTITCNFDGQEKHQTIIGDGVFIGSDTQLIAPIRVGENATIGAGTTVKKDVLPNQLIHNLIEHRIVKNWKLNSNKSNKSQTKVTVNKQSKKSKTLTAKKQIKSEKNVKNSKSVKNVKKIKNVKNFRKG